MFLIAAGVVIFVLFKTKYRGFWTLVLIPIVGVILWNFAHSCYGGLNRTVQFFAYSDTCMWKRHYSYLPLGSDERIKLEVPQAYLFSHVFSKNYSKDEDERVMEIASLNMSFDQMSLRPWSVVIKEAEEALEQQAEDLSERTITKSEIRKFLNDAVIRRSVELDFQKQTEISSKPRNSYLSEYGVLVDNHTPYFNEYADHYPKGPVKYFGYFPVDPTATPYEIVCRNNSAQGKTFAQTKLKSRCTARSIHPLNFLYEFSISQYEIPKVHEIDQRVRELIARLVVSP